MKLTYDPIDANATKIKIYESTNGGASYSTAGTVGATATIITINNLTPETEYYFKIAAMRDLNISEISGPVHATTPVAQTAPAAPSNLTADATSCSEVALSWTDNADNEDHFVVERKEAGGSYSVLATVDPDTTLYTDSTVEGNKTYYYRVKATNTTGDSSYATSSAVNVPACATVPNEPEDLAATAISSSEIDLSWSDNSNNEDGFKIERKTAGGTYSAIATVGSNVTTYKDTGLNSGTTYYYRVRAFNSEGFSAYSNSANATTKSNAVQKTVIKLWPDNPNMLVNGVKQEIDLGRGTKPIIIPEWGRTVVPIRAIVEALGGTIGWDGVERKVTIHFNGTLIELWIDNPKAKVNGIEKWIDPNNHDVKPIIVNSRTMLPLRFVAESLGCKVDWDAATRTITITYMP